MTRSIPQWQRAAHELARAKGEHTHPCPHCEGDDHYKMRGMALCHVCDGAGRIEVDNKSPVRIASRLALIHLAISRAVECVVAGEMELGWSNTKHAYMRDAVARNFWKEEFEALRLREKWQPQGFSIALADVFLRLCDLAESLGIELNLEREVIPPRPDPSSEGSLARLGYLHEVLATKALDLRGALNSALSELQLVSDIHNVDLFAMAELKHAYNALNKHRKPA